MKLIKISLIALCASLGTPGYSEAPTSEGDFVDPSVISKMLDDQAVSEQERKQKEINAANELGWIKLAGDSDPSIEIYPHVINLKVRNPTVLVLHGSGGTGAHHWEWAQRLRGWGFNTVLVESFKPRGYSTIVSDQRLLPADRVPDVIRTAKWVLQQPWSDGHIGLIGFSHGANTVFEASIRGGGLIKAGVAYYPYCHPWFSQHEIPIQLHLAAEDNWTPPETCASLKAGLNTRNAELTIFTYPESGHGFDSIRMPIKFQAMTVNGMREVTWGGNPVQGKVSYERAAEFLLKHLAPK